MTARPRGSTLVAMALLAVAGLPSRAADSGAGQRCFRGPIFCEVITTSLNEVAGGEQVGVIVGLVEDRVGDIPPRQDDTLAGSHALAVECTFAVHSEDTASRIVVSGTATAAGDAVVSTTYLRCLTRDRFGNTVDDQVTMQPGAIATVADVPVVPDTGPYTFCAEAQASFTDSHSITFPRTCVSPSVLA